MANLQPLRNYIRQNIGRLRSSPCLIISSSPPPAAISTAVAGTKTPSSIPTDQQERKQQKEQLKFQQQQNDSRVHAFVQRNTQSLALEFNLKTVPCTISSAYPTLSSVYEAVALAKRAGLKEGSAGSGDGTVIGIGSGAAMELAKAVADTLFGDIASCKDATTSKDDADSEGGGSLVLAPCTLGGLWAASSNSPSLLLDTVDELILPHLTSSWQSFDEVLQRNDTVVTLDPSRYLAMPPLYSTFEPMKRSEYSSQPSMAHVAAAALAIVLDTAWVLDINISYNNRVSGKSNEREKLQQHIAEEIKTVSSACASVLQLAIKEAKSDGSSNNNDVDTASNHKLAQQHLLDAIPRLSPIIEQSSILAQAPLVSIGTLPQRMANALLPSHFPQCHIVSYIACILPGLCDEISRNKVSSSKGKMSIVEDAVNAIMTCDGNTEKPSLSSWASEVTMEAGIPSMASLAFGTPDLNALVRSLDSYYTLHASPYCGQGIDGEKIRDDHWHMQSILNDSLIR